MSCLFHPKLRYWQHETPELLTATLCLKMYLSRDIVTLICQMMRRKDNAIQWLHTWYNHSEWHSKNPLICTQAPNNHIPGYEMALHNLVAYFDVARNKTQYSWLRPINLEIDPSNLNIAQVTPLIWKETTGGLWMTKIRMLDILLGIIIPEGDDKIHFNLVDDISLPSHQSLGFQQPFDRYITIDIDILNFHMDKDRKTTVENIEHVQTERKKLWYTDIYPVPLGGYRNVWITADQEPNDNIYQVVSVVDGKHRGLKKYMHGGLKIGKYVATLDALRKE